MDLIRGVDLRDQLGAIDVPTLVCVGDLDPATPVSASEEIVAAMERGLARLEVVPGAGHFPWLDAPDVCFGLIADFASAH